MYEFDDTGNGSRLFSAETSNSYIMEPQIDLFWLVATLFVVFGANGVYRRIRNFPAFAWKFTKLLPSLSYLNLTNYVYGKSQFCYTLLWSGSAKAPGASCESAGLLWQGFFFPKSHK